MPPPIAGPVPRNHHHASGRSALRASPGARSALAERLLPRASVVTPNLPEARALLGAGEGVAAVEVAAGIRALGPAAVIVTGGHADGTDLLDDGGEPLPIPGPIHPDGAAHGSGCTHSSALAAHLALGYTPLEAARAAKTIAEQAVRDGLRSLGTGPGPVDVFALTKRPRARLESVRAGTGPLP